MPERLCSRIPSLRSRTGSSARASRQDDKQSNDLLRAAVAHTVRIAVNSVTEEVKQRINLVELIGRSVQLRRVGNLYRGLCPFHQEKTPSFYVRPQTNTWRCFGCDKSGTAFDWLMEREHLDFGEALRQLAQEAGVTLPTRREPEDEERRHRLYRILQQAQTYYEGLLAGTQGTKARDYVSRRGLTAETVQAFGLGYAGSGNGLLRYLDAEGYSEQELQSAGVIGIADDGREYDFFRERLLFPIRDTQGRTIAFGGRSLEDAATPKYLNSRDTLLFHKQETLFAFDLARRPMIQERQVVIVEGYMDALMAHQHGYRNVVATLGTAVTDRHLRLLHRQVDEIVLALDADAAGQAATWRAMQVADESLRTGLTPVVGPSRRPDQERSDRVASAGSRCNPGYRLRPAASGGSPRSTQRRGEGGCGTRDSGRTGRDRRSNRTGPLHPTSRRAVGHGRRGRPPIAAAHTSGGSSTSHRGTRAAAGSGPRGQIR